MKDDKYLGSCNLKDDNKLHNPPKQTKNKTKQKKTPKNMQTKWYSRPNKSWSENRAKANF